MLAIIELPILLIRQSQIAELKQLFKAQISIDCNIKLKCDEFHYEVTIELTNYHVSETVHFDINNMQASNQNPLKQIPIVTISPAGIFKYILITCKGEFHGKAIDLPHYFVRGYKGLGYHKQNFEKFIAELKANGLEIKSQNSKKGHFEAVKGSLKLKFECPGGGRIEHNHQGKKCHIYGYSKSYGRVDHKIAQRLVSKALGYAMNQITTSQEGY